MTAAAGFRGFRPAAFGFLRDPSRHDDKVWFEAHRDVYEREVRDPMRRIAPEIIGDPRRSLFRTCFVAGGIWMPARPALQRIREAIDAQPTALTRLTSAPAFRRRFELSTEPKLRRVPREFPPDHPAAEWLKRQSFTTRAFIERSVVTSPRLVDRLCRDFALLVALVRWLNRALGYQPAQARRREASSR